MTENERQELEQERKMLKLLLDYHLQNDLGGWTKSKDLKIMSMPRSIV